MKRFLLFMSLLLIPWSSALACTPSEISTEIDISKLYPNPIEGEVEWIELTNLSEGTIDLSFYTIEDETGKPWELIGTLSPFGSARLSGFPFQLNNGGDTVVLKTLHGIELDSLSYDSSQSGQEIPLSGGQEAQEESIQLTTPNEWPVFSEALPNPEGSDSTDEWIELYNPYPYSLVLEGLRLDDREGGSSAHELSGTIPAETYLVIWIEDSGLTLNNSEDHVRLLGSLGEILWDIPYDGAKEGSSYADLGSFYDWTTSTTPGSPNQISTDSTESEFENGDLSESVEITEVFPNPDGPDQDLEWIEITNGGAEAVNMGNWILDDGENGSAPYTLPDDIIIEPGETLVIERTESGLALNNSNETVQLIDFTGEVVDEIYYESTEEGLSFSVIEIEDLSNEQASLTALSNRFFETWEWVSPTPGEENPSWKQLKGEVIEFDGTLLTLYDGITNWTIKTDSKKTDALFYQPGNSILVRLAMVSGVYHVMHSELIESKTHLSKSQLPWEWISLVALATIYLGFELYKKKKAKIQGPFSVSLT